MTDEVESPQDSLASPGAMLKAAREQQELSTREVADRLNWMPGYTAIIERDEFHALRRPAFARGYVKAYGKLLDLDEERLLEAFDRQFAAVGTPQEKKPVRSQPAPLQRTGAGVVIGLVLLLLLVLVIWWWRGDTPQAAAALPGGEQTGAAYLSSLALALNPKVTGEK